MMNTLRRRNRLHGETRSERNRNAVDRVELEKFKVEKQWTHSAQHRALVVLIAISVGVMHRYYVATMFENFQHFSHLSDLERELSFRTESGFYFSFYKSLITSPSFFSGLNRMLHDNTTEYGHEINDLKRFTVYMEVITAALYRTFKSVSEYFNFETQVCWHTMRGENKEPVMSCEVFAFAGLVASALFLFGYLMSDSIFGGLITILCYMYNHGQSTRIQWNPCLRESYGYCWFLLLLLCITAIIKSGKASGLLKASVATISCLLLLSWQFGPFILTTVVFSVFFLNISGHISAPVFKGTLNALLCGLFAAVALLFGNEMLICSLYTSSLFAAMASLMVEKQFLGRMRSVWLIKLVIFLVATTSVKMLTAKWLSVTDDAHIFDLIRSKFTGERTFDTHLYLCMIEFDFLPYQDILALLKTALFPSALLMLLNVFLLNTFSTEKGQIYLPKSSCTTIYLNAIQLCCFMILAGLIMRLKLFFVPHMCILCSLMSSQKFLSISLKRSEYKKYLILFVLLLLVGMSYKGCKNVHDDLTAKGEFSDPTREELMIWIQKHTARNAVFAGSMPEMAAVKLSAERPVVVHPHYEDSALRARVKTVYRMYSRIEPDKYYEILKSIHVDYLIMQYAHCPASKPSDVRRGCYIPEVWDELEPKNRHQEVFCRRILQDPYPFTVAFKNNAYLVLRL